MAAVYTSGLHQLVTGRRSKPLAGRLQPPHRHVVL